MANFPISFFTIFVSIIGIVQASRLISLNPSDQQVSDGVDGGETQFPVRHNLNISALKAGSCEHVYGFLPCAENIAGYVFQIILFQYLLMVGGQLVTDGSKKLFTMLGTGVFGASVFRVLLNFPRIIFVIMSGVLTTEEQAQRQVGLSIGINAGSTVFILTLAWGIVGIIGRRNISEDSSSEPTASTPLLQNENSSANSKPFLDKISCSDLNETGIKTDKKTSYTAGIMVLSLVPFVIAEFANISNSSSGSRIVVLIALIVSVISLISYFIYQLWDPWMQERSLEYSKYQNLVSGFMNYVQKQTKGKLVDANGQPSLPAIERLFSENDQDADRSLTQQELQKLMVKIQAGEVEVDKDYAVDQVLKVFDLNSDGRISEDEFIEGSKKWINEAQNLEQNGDSTIKESLNEVIQPFMKKRRDELSEIEDLMGNILKHVQSQALAAKSLIKDDGTPDIERIQTLFKQFGCNDDNSISQSELKQLIQTVKFGESEVVNTDEAVIKVIRGLDKNGNDMIDELEFVQQVKKWLNDAVQVLPVDVKTQSSNGQISWEEVDKLIYKVQQKGSCIMDVLSVAWEYMKPLLQIIFGVVMLTFLTKPFMANIIQLSTALGISTFFLSFVLIPILMNARVVTSAFFPANQKSSVTASLTFSEIYGDVIMNNIMGVTTLLAIVYAKEMAWDYTAEVLVLVMVTAVVGLFALFSTTYPLWTCFFAFFLYLFSLGLYNLVHNLWGWN